MNDDYVKIEPKPGEVGKLTKDYIQPPFTVLNSNMPGWLTRKRQWKSFGLVGETGRDDTVYSKSFEDIDYLARYKRRKPTSATSIFDPHLTELLVLWHTNPNDMIYDPFAGGPPRGMISSLLGREYAGIELRSKQVEANFVNYEEIKKNWHDRGGQEIKFKPAWLIGDSTKPETIIDDDFKCDFVMTCPPYGDLEVYSDDPRDISTLPYQAFLELYEMSLEHAVKYLHDDRFFAIVVGEFRDKENSLRNFVGDTAHILKKLGLNYNSENIFATPRNTAMLRTGGFKNSRKLVRTHQNMLTFVKGDPVKATARLIMPISPIYDLERFMKKESSFF